MRSTRKSRRIASGAPAAPARALEAELERLEARAGELEREKTELEAFAALAAHELLEPLVMTEAYASLVCERLDERRHAASRRDLDVLSRDAARVRGLVETLLHDARSDERRSRVDLSALVHDCLASLAPEITARNARIEVAPLPCVIGDERLIRVVLTTLLATALRCGRPGNRITVHATRRAGRRSISLLTDGPPIPLEERERIFGSHHHDGPAWSPPGATLGLTICRHLVQRHHGQIGLSATDRPGNHFFFTLPPRAR
jgi:light-regulated signal transduction histidine kinase (bacteriophytochrome)